MIDVVYNHTSPDSVLWQEHPEFFYRKPDGQPGNHVGEWTDVIDLDYRCEALWDYQIETLKYWAGIVDGFRCDVASFVPVDFWVRARREIAAFRPDFLWLAESVHRSFSVACRRSGMVVARDVEAYEAFDLEYEYDVREAFDRCLRGTATLSHWMDLLNFQEFAYPANYNKLRYLENHDTPRIASRVAGGQALRNYTALLFFLKGTTLLYGGQEAASARVPGLFDPDPVEWDTGTDLTPFLQTLARLKKEALSPEDLFEASADDGRHIAVLLRDDRHRCKIGIFSLQGQEGPVSVPLPDGQYENLLNEEPLTVAEGRIHCDGSPVWMSVPSDKVLLEV